MSAIRHVLTILAVADLHRSVRFYCEVFGWDVAVTTSVYVEFALPGGMRFGLYEKTAFGANVGRVPGGVPDGELSGTELYFYAEDIGPAIERMRRAGARELAALAEKPWGDEAAYFADPEGNVIVLARPLVT